MANTCILVASSCEARIYEVNRGRLIRECDRGEHALSLLKKFSHRDSRKKVTELVSDRNGYYPRKGSHSDNGTVGMGGTFAEPTNPKEVEAEKFARELAQALEERRLNTHWRDVLIVAEPHFQGLVNKYLSEPLHDMVTTIDKNYTRLNDRQLAKQLVEQL